MCTSGEDTDSDDGGTTTGTGAGGGGGDEDYPGDGTPGDTSVPCDQVKAIRGQFADPVVKCGDRTFLNSQGTNLSEGCIVGFSIYRGRDQAPLDAVGDMMFSEQTHTEWVPRKPLDGQAGDAYFFMVSGDGESAQSGNYFQFAVTPNYGPEEKAWHCTSGIYGWDAKFDIAFHDETVYVHVKIKLIQWFGDDPEHPGSQAPPVSDENKAFLKNDIEPRLSNKLFLNRQNCSFGTGCSCTKPVVVTVDFVESGEYHVVNYYQGEFRADSGHWPRVRYSAPMWAHEVGHLLGWYDEYQPDGATGPPPRWQPDAPTHLMNSGEEIPAEYGWDFRDWLAGKTGEPWTVT